MPPAPLLPADITLPEPGSTTAREVLSRSLQVLLRDLSAAPRHAPPGAAAEAAALASMARAALQSAPGALMSALRRPTVSGPLRCLRDPALPGREAVFVDLVAQLAFELALADALPTPVRLARVPPCLLAVAARLGISFTEPPRAVTFASGRLEVEHAGGTTRVELRAPASSGVVVVERPYHGIAGDIALAERDNNPIAMFEAHPDKAGNQLDLGGRTAAAWTSALGEAVGRIERYLPEIGAEMQLFVAQIVPVGWHEQRHLSASYQEVVGTIYMTLHPSQMTLTEALIHEFSHNKINALFDLDPLLSNAWSPLYTSPVRPDPRPLHGVLLAVHAFLPVARLYEKMIAAGAPEAESAAFHERYAAIRKINREGAELVLDEGAPTAVGRAVFAEIRRWHEHYRQLDVT
jgi:HEXXH motif-containing protein